MEKKNTVKTLARESMVLLKNDNRLLPLEKEKRIAIFGRMQIDFIYSGNGSGAANVDKCKNIVQACEEKGLLPEQNLVSFYMDKIKAEPKKVFAGLELEELKNMVNSGLMYEVFGRYQPTAQEYEVEQTLIKQARDYTDTAVFVLGRNSGGEECDRHLENDYYLTESEKKLVDMVNDTFEHVVLILNVNGLIDLSWVKEKPHFESVLFVGIPGQEGAEAIAELLTGEATPSGKLSFTIAEKYEDYPAYKHFSWDKDHPENLLTYRDYGLDASENGCVGHDLAPVTVYQEDIYTGYRYFDTFQKEPLYPFGYGLSYTSFSLTILSAKKSLGGITVEIKVQNTGDRIGREVIQMYVSSRISKMNRPQKELKAFEKTSVLQPGESEIIDVFMRWTDLGIYDELEASWLIPEGIHTLLIGNSSSNVEAAVNVKVKKNILVEKVNNRLSLAECNKNRIDFLTAEGSNDTIVAPFQVELTSEEVINIAKKSESWKKSFEHAKIKAETVVKKLSIEQLAAMCVGYGAGTPFGAFNKREEPYTICDDAGKPLTENDHPTGFQGYVSPAIKEEGIPSVFYKDGPAGIGEIAWPTEMLCACSFDKQLWYAFGKAIGEECEKKQVDYWLAPAVNMLRHPLGGRNFEYPSEDPYLAGMFGCQIAKGTQENHPVMVCPKHFAINEQETCRRGNHKKNYYAVDSIIQERAAREIYLKPFEMLVKEAGVLCMMTSFNRINGIFAGGNRDLCKHILREEWGYCGYLVTDWGDMDFVVDGADAVGAGNDIVMPGGPPVIAQILEGYAQGRINRENLETAVVNLLSANLRYGR